MNENLIQDCFLASAEEVSAAVEVFWSIMSESMLTAVFSPPNSKIWRQFCAPIFSLVLLCSISSLSLHLSVPPSLSSSTFPTLPYEGSENGFQRSCSSFFVKFSDQKDLFSLYFKSRFINEESQGRNVGWDRSRGGTACWPALWLVHRLMLSWLFYQTRTTFLEMVSPQWVGPSRIR